MKNIVSLLLIIGIALVLNLLSKQFFFRWDLTNDKRYTLSQATHDVLGNLEDPVLVKAYFSKELPIQYNRGKEEFQDLLNEYANISKGMFDFEFIDPADDPAIEQEANQKGIPPVQMQVRENDQLNIKKGYLGAAIELGEQSDAIQVIQKGMPMEYALTTAIKKMAVLDKPSLGILTGYGGAGQEQLAQVYQQLSILYNVEDINLNTFTEELTPLRFKSLALVGAKDSIPPAHFEKLSAYMNAGGGMLIGVDAVNGDLQQGQGSASLTGVETWLLSQGVKIEPSFLIDESCGNVTVQQRQGFFVMNNPKPFPFLPIIKDFAEHPITKGLEGVILPFASPVQSTGDTAFSYTPILFSSSVSGTVPAPAPLQVVDRRWSASDFPLSQVHAGAVVTNNNGGRLVVIGDGGFPEQGGGQGQGGDNQSLMTNSLDWLSDDTGLIDLRTKGVAFNPLEEIEPERKNFLKWFNFLLPLILVVLYGFYRNAQTKAKRNQRAQQDYNQYA